MVTKPFTTGVRRACRCAHASNQYDAPPSVRYHNFGGFTSSEISPMDVYIEKFPRAIEGISI